MADPEPPAPPPPLHEIDGYHAATIDAIERWSRDVYPKLCTLLETVGAGEGPDQTLLWWNVSAHLYEQVQGDSDPGSAIARLAQMAAELLLSNAQHITERKYP